MYLLSVIFENVFNYIISRLASKKKGQQTSEASVAPKAPKVPKLSIDQLQAMLKQQMEEQEAAEEDAASEAAEEEAAESAEEEATEVEATGIDVGPDGDPFIEPIQMRKI